MRETSLESLESLGVSGSQLRNIGIVVLLIVCIILWGSYVIVPAGSRGVVLWLGRVERIMNEGFYFKVPLTGVIKVDVRVQPHPFRRSMPPPKNISY